MVFGEIPMAKVRNLFLTLYTLFSDRAPSTTSETAVKVNDRIQVLKVTRLWKALESGWNRRRG